MSLCRQAAQDQRIENRPVREHTVINDLTIELLADRPEAMPLVAGWYFAEWGHLNPSATLERVRAKLLASMNRDAIPLTVLAVIDEEVVGAAQLKYREMPMFPEKEHWLGGVYVAPEHRGHAIAARLADSVVETARNLGVKTLHIQTERLDGGLYARLGWTPVEQVNRGPDVLVMQRAL